MVGESPLCLSVHSSSVSFHRCCHCLVNDRAHMLLGSRLICFVLSGIARFVKASAGLQWLARSETLSEISPHHRVDTISFIIHTCSSYAVAQSHEHGEHRLLHRPIKIHRSVTLTRKPCKNKFALCCQSVADSNIWSVMVAVKNIQAMCGRRVVSNQGEAKQGEVFLVGSQIGEHMAPSRQ